MRVVLPTIIGDQQTGFMEGRQIHNNIRKCIDIISHIYQSGKKAVVVSIDFKKCFDHIEHESIYAMLKYFEFGDTFIKWIRLFFTQIEICTQNAGYCSQFFTKGRGVNQACNISPFLFNGISEIMSHLIKSNPHIKGIKTGESEVENVISQFADDTALFLIYEESCINAAISTLMHVESNTGLKVSYEKTCIYRVGSLKDTDAKCYTIKPLKWSDGDIDLLGVTIKNDSKQTNVQFDKIIEKMEHVAHIWFHRNLTLIGRILVINTLMASPLADLGGREGHTPPPGRPNSFDFMQFSGKFGVFTPPWRVHAPPLGKILDPPLITVYTCNDRLIKHVPTTNIKS